MGGIPDFLKDEQTGLMCALGNPSDIASKIVRILNNPELADRLGRAGRALVERSYTWDGIAEQFKHFYGQQT